MEWIVAVIGSKGLIEEKIQTYLEILRENGFLLVEQETHELFVEQAQLLLPSAFPNFSLATFTNGPCVILMLKHPRAYATFESILGELEDTYYSLTPWLSKRDLDVFFPKQTQLERMAIIVKPGYTQQQYIHLLEILDKHDFLILSKQAKILNGDVIEKLFGDDVKVKEYLISDLSIVFLVEKLNALIDFHLLCGPEDPNEAREIAPHTLRASMGSSLLQNFCYASADESAAKRDVELLFLEPLPIERTVAAIYPDCVQHAHEIENVMQQHGFTILSKQTLTLSRARLERIYAQSLSLPTSEQLLTYLSSGPCIFYLLSRSNAIEAWRHLVGPEPTIARQVKPNSLRARLGQDNIRVGIAASIREEVDKEIEEYFPGIVIQHIPTLPQLTDLLHAKPAASPSAPVSSLHDILVEGLTALCRVKPTGDDAILWFANWLEDHNPAKPRIKQPDDDENENEDRLEQEKQKKARKIVWLIGAPNTRKSHYAAKIALEKGYELVNVVQVLNAAIQHSSKHGETIRSYLQELRPIPTRIVLDLVSSAIAQHPSSSIVVCGFPFSLEQAFEFEKVVGNINSIIYLSANREEAQVRGIVDNTPNYLRKLKTFEEDIAPVIEHYALFKKLKTINALEEEREIEAQIRAAVP